MNNINLEEFSNIFKYLISNNKRLVKEGKNPIAVGIEGAAGLGKTTILQDLAQEMGMTCVKLSLSELEEVSDLTGFPIKEYKISVNDRIEHPTENGEVEYEDNWVTKWVAADLLSIYTQMPCEDYKILDDSRMSYATPAWLPREENPNGTILILDDYTRANSLFMQATMELINTGKYISWHLPSNTTIVLEKCSI